MINFDGAILMDITSVSGGAYGTPEANRNTPDGVDVYVYRIIPAFGQQDLEICEGCGYEREPVLDPNEPAEPMYTTYAVEANDTMCPSLSYCQACMESLKEDYDRDPYSISAYGRIVDWFIPTFASGHFGGTWKEFS